MTGTYEKTRQMGFTHSTIEQYLEAVAKYPPPNPEIQAECRIHRPRIGVGIISIDEATVLKTLEEKQKVMDAILKANEAFSATGVKLTPP